MQRVVESEWLDQLPSSAPEAMRARSDLRRINYVMGHFGLMERMLQGLARPKRIVELGGGDGMFWRKLAGRLASRWPAVEFVLVDRQLSIQPSTLDEFTRLGWQMRVAEADVFDWLAQGQGADVITANLFLHHFVEPELAKMFQMAAAQSHVVAACEPRRCPRCLLGSKLVRLIGCGPVTRRDAVTSVRAGFHGQELSAAWPCREGWELREYEAGLASHCFFARRR
jgi:hypothetical protein